MLIEALHSIIYLCRLLILMIYYLIILIRVLLVLNFCCVYLFCASALKLFLYESGVSSCEIKFCFHG